MDNSIINHLDSKGFFAIKVDRPGSIQICANHSSGVGAWFYSKRSIASLSIYSTHWGWSDKEKGEIDIYKIWDWMKGEEIDYFDLPVKDEMGGLLEDKEVLWLFDAMWSQYINQLVTH